MANTPKKTNSDIIKITSMHCDDLLITNANIIDMLRLGPIRIMGGGSSREESAHPQYSFINAHESGLQPLISVISSVRAVHTIPFLVPHVLT